MSTNPQHILYYTNITLFLLSGLLLWSIGMRPSSRRIQLSRSLTIGLWGFTPQLETKQLHESNVWNWRKLLCAGVMMSSMVGFSTVKYFTVQTTIKLSCGILITWIIFLYIFWYTAIVPSSSEAVPVSASSDEKSSTSDFKAPSSGWLSKTKVNSRKDSRLPLTVVTGFLGSGKTTLVKHLLRNTEGMKILVVENEVGKEGVDHELLLQHTEKENIVLMNNGCVCCTVRGDLIATFQSLFSTDAFSKLDWVVLETTGLADPAPVIQSVYMDKQCNSHLRLDGVLTVVDSKHVMLHIGAADKGAAGAHAGSSVPEAVQQIAFADRVILNKTDLIDETELQDVVTAVQKINPNAGLLTTVQSKVSVEDVLSISAFDPTKISKTTPMFQIQTDAQGKIISSKKSKKPKAKAVSEFGSVSTLSLTSLYPLDLNAFNIWIAQLLKDKGNDLYRFKGILCMEGYDQKFVVQGIHMIFNGELGPEWEKNETRRSKFVFIGANLNHSQLKQEFEACIAKRIRAFKSLEPDDSSHKKDD